MERTSLRLRIIGVNELFLANSFIARSFLNLGIPIWNLLLQ
jgi:hypothetical protein